MKIRTCFIMRFVHSHNVIMYRNKMKPRLLMLHFTPAVSTAMVTRENKNSWLSLTTFRAGAVYIMKKRERNNFFLIYE
jgi:hypothetical protein